MPDTKQCTKCGETQPLDNFHKTKARPDGRTPSCKTCRNEQSRRYREANLEYVQEYDRMRRKKNPPRTCSKCGETKPTSMFHQDRSKADGYAPSCKLCNALTKNPKDMPAGTKLQWENRRRYLKIASQLNDDEEDELPYVKGRCTYIGCKQNQNPKYDPHNLGLCEKHGKNAATVLGYKLTAA